MTSDHLVLTDETLRVLYTLLPFGEPATQVGLARNSFGRGHLALREVWMLADLLTKAADDPWCLVTPEALGRATAEFRSELREVGLTDDERELDGEVSVYVWDESRDGPIEGTRSSVPSAWDGGGQAVADAAARPATRPENRQPPRNVPSSAR